jgi:hypothetical protein
LDLKEFATQFVGWDSWHSTTVLSPATAGYSWIVDAIAPPSTRRGIRSEDQRAVDSYKAAFKTYADDHNIWKLVSDLTLNVPFMLPEHVHDCFNAIDGDAASGMLQAEKKAKRPTGKYAWCPPPQLRDTGLAARFWHLRLKAAEGQIRLHGAIYRLLQRYQSLNIVLDPLVLCTDAAELKLHWKDALKKLRTIRGKEY